MLLVNGSSGDTELLCFFRHSAENRADLSMHRVTHILNAAHSKRRGQPDIYEGMKITYMGIEAHDTFGFDMSVNFQAAADFIHGALSRGGETMVTKSKAIRFGVIL